MTTSHSVGSEGGKTPSSISLRLRDKGNFMKLMTYIALIGLLLAVLPLVKAEWVCEPGVRQMTLVEPAGA